MWVHGVGWRRLEPDEQKADAQAGCTYPLRRRETFTKQKVTEQNRHKKLPQSQQSGLHPANMFYSQEQHES